MDTALFVLEIIGYISFAISGAIVAIDNETDLFGVLMLAIVTSFGGGVLRDLLIGNQPVVFFTSYVAVAVCAVTSLAVFVIAFVFKKKYVENEKIVNRINNYFDALGLGLFVALGAKICMDFGITNPFAIFICGMLSGTGGSVTRDIILGDIPLVLRKRIYVLAALVGVVLYWGLIKLDVEHVFATAACAGMVFVIRLLATIFEWDMPKAIDFSKLREEESSPKE